MAFFKTSAKDFLENLIGGAAMTKGGKERKLEELAVREMALYTAVSWVADIISGCEILVYEDEKPVKNGNWYVWNVDANPNQTAKELMFEWVFDLYTKGKGLVIPLSKHLYVADKYAIEEYPLKGDAFSGISIRSYGINKIFKAKDVYFLSQRGGEIKRLLDGIFRSYDELLSDSRKSTGKNSGDKYVLNVETFPSGTQTERDAYLDRIKDNLKTFASNDSGAYVTTKGQTLNRLAGTSSSSATDYISIRKEVYAICASALHIPSGLLEGNTTASDQLFNQALTAAIDPLAQRIGAELTRKTYTQDEITYGGCRMVVDTSAIKHVDVVDMADSLDKLIASGLMCIDEVRRRCRLPEINEDWSQSHYLTKNYSDIKEFDPLEGKQKNAGTEGTGETGEEDES